MTWVIVKNTNAHKALHTMRLGAKSLTEIKNLIKYQGSINKFQADVMNILTNGGFVKRRDERFYITERGDNALIEHGAPRKINRENIHYISCAPYDGIEIKISVQRHGADDHMNYPSRRGNKLYYRDGRIEDV